MRVLIVGLGRMGREVATIARDRGHTVAGSVDPQASDATWPHLDAVPADACDVAIEFAGADGIADRVGWYAERKVGAVVGTTGYDPAEIDERRFAFSGMVRGGNFSLGMQVFYRIVRDAARRIAALDDYDAGIIELHHRQKVDSPSGTARELAEILVRESSDKRSVVEETLHRRPASHELHVASGRIGSIPGTHQVLFDSPYDSIELVHRARTREGFARGAVRLAEWIVGRRGVFRADQAFASMIDGEDER